MFESQSIHVFCLFVVLLLHEIVPLLLQLLGFLRVFHTLGLALFNVSLQCHEVWIIFWDNRLLLRLLLGIGHKILPFVIVVARFFP